MRHYYRSRKDAEGFRGEVYHYDETGNRTISDYRGPLRMDESRALDDAAEWLEAQGVEAELG